MPESKKCTCGNPDMGFDCSCEWSRRNPGNTTYSCIFCGIYEASKPRCNECEPVDGIEK